MDRKLIPLLIFIFLLAPIGVSGALTDNPLLRYILGLLFELPLVIFFAIILVKYHLERKYNAEYAKMLLDTFDAWIVSFFEAEDCPISKHVIKVNTDGITCRIGDDDLMIDVDVQSLAKEPSKTMTEAVREFLRKKEEKEV